MLRIKKGSRTAWLLVFLAVSLFLFYGMAAAAEKEGHTPVHEGVSGTGPQDAAEGSHGADRSADIRDLFYRYINFALLVIILVLALKKFGLKKSLRGRMEAIKQRLDDLIREKEEAEEKYQDISRKLQDFQQQRKGIIEQFQKEGLAEKEKIIAQAKERAKQIVERAELTIRQEIQSAKEGLRKEILDLAAQGAQEIIAKRMTDEDQDRLVNDFIERVGKIH